MAVAALVTTAGAVAHSAALRVPEDYSSVLAAVDAAASGDSVLVGPGTWTHTDTRVVNINGQSLPITAGAFLKPGIVVLGVSGPAVTVLQPEPGAGLIHVIPGAATFVEGLTIRADQGVEVSQGSRLELMDCWLFDSSINAVALSASAHASLRNCRIEDNSWNSPLSSALEVQSSRLEIYDSEIRGNVGKHAVWVFGSEQVIMEGCVVSGHKNFGACKFDTVLDLQVRNSTFLDNVDAGAGAGVDAIDSFGVVEFCLFARNAAQAGGGMAMVRGSVRVENSTFYACDAQIGSAMSISGNDPGMHNNIIAYSTGQYGAVDRTQGNNHPATGCNLFWGNEVQDYSTVGTWTPSATDVYADPEFCDPDSDDFTLHSSSPGASGVTPACGTIGALGVGCGSVSIESTSWGRIKGQYR
jgi:hypothetical protein